MEKIIQLTESEYNKLYARAYLNEQQIQEHAQEMYEKDGAFEIRITLKCDQDRNETISIGASSLVFLSDKSFISYEDKYAVMEFVDKQATKFMERNFGRQISTINVYNKRIDMLRNWKLKFIGWTIFGWIAALTCAIIALSK